MKKHRLAQALALGIALSFASTSPAADGPDPDRVWVKFTPGSQAQVRQSLRAAGGRIHHEFEELGAIAVSVPRQALQGLGNNPNIEYIEPDVVRHPMAQVRPYGIDMVQAPQAWAAGATGDGVMVCVIDSGIHAAHEDFQGVNLVGGFPSGWNTDSCGHGSHVTGTIAAADNDLGVVGVATGNIDIYTLKVFNGSNCGWSYSSTLVDAANRCANAGARIINMSLGGSTSSTTESNAFQNLYNNGVLSIAAAGNAGNTRLSYPASYNSVISVAAIDANKQHASFSQRNSQVELAAPGVSVLSTVPFESASATIDQAPYIVSALDGSFQGTASGTVANGGRCLSPGSWSNRVVMCERGDISFADKAANVAAGGGRAAIIYNNEPGGFSGTLGSGGSSIPALAMTREDGVFIVGSKVGASASVSTVVNNQGNGYAFYDGTSMATPHVAGVAALVWSAAPWASAQEVREALAVTAEDLGAAGRDNSYGWGLVRAADAIAYLTGNGGGDPGPGPDPDPEDPTGITARVGNITLSHVSRGPNTNTTAAVTIVDQNGAAIGGASVTGCFSGAVSGCSTASTNGSGNVSFQSGNYRGTTLSFCVVDVTGPNDDFDSINACRSR
ncbi:MAG: S8 family serine peptidase [Lysobacteraceae bacterium]